MRNPWLGVILGVVGIVALGAVAPDLLAVPLAAALAIGGLAVLFGAAAAAVLFLLALTQLVRRAIYRLPR